MSAPARAVLQGGIIDPLLPEPSATPPLPPGVTYAQIFNRWRTLLPRLRIRRLDTSDVALLAHRRACLDLLQQGVAWRAVCRLNLDDPSADPADRLFQRERYLDRTRRAKIRKPRGPNRPKEDR